MARTKDEIAHEIEYLEDLLRSDGWRVFSGRVLEEWQNAGFFSQTTNALKAPDPVVELKVLHKTAINLLGLLDWPTTRIAYLRKLA